MFAASHLSGDAAEDSGPAGASGCGGADSQPLSFVITLKYKQRDAVQPPWWSHIGTTGTAAPESGGFPSRA